MKLLASETEPDEVERCSHSQEQAAEGEPVVAIVEPVVNAEADAAPDQKAGDEVSEDGPESTFIIGCHGRTSCVRRAG